MPSAKTGKDKKEALLAEVLGVGAGQVTESALDSKASMEARKPLGRPAKEATIPFTVRLTQASAELLQVLVADLQARALRGEFPRSAATMGTVVEQGLQLYAAKHGIKP